MPFPDRPAYPPEVRRQMVALVRSGRTPEDLAKEFAPSAAVIRRWVAKAQIEERAAAAALSSAEREELVRLREEVRQLRAEREVLVKAAALFARESQMKL